MAEALTPVRTLAEWTGRATTVSEVLRQLSVLRRQAENEVTSRTAVVTLVVVATSAVDAWDALATVHRFGGRHPARSIVVVPDARADRRLDARVSLAEATAGGHGVWFEDVVLSVGGPAAGHLSSLLEPFTLPDLPVAVWWVGGPPDPADDVLRAADVLLVDSKVAVGEHGGDADPDGPEGAAPDLDNLRAIAALFPDHVVVDLAWQRLAPWRRLLARLFDGPAFRPHLTALTSVEVAGKPGARALLSGWLGSRLEIGEGRLHLVDARHASVVLRSELDGAVGTFAVERAAGERQVRASAAVEGGPTAVDVLSLPEPDLSWSLGEALAALRRDPAYEAAVVAAASR